MLQGTPSLSCTSLQRCSLISSTDHMEHPRISTSLLSPDLRSSPWYGGRGEGEDRMRVRVGPLRGSSYTSCCGSDSSQTNSQKDLLCEEYQIYKSFLINITFSLLYKCLLYKCLRFGLYWARLAIQLSDYRLCTGK